jgi:hypothetical protein
MRRVMFAVLACVALPGCYQGYQLGGCDKETAEHHTVNDFGGIQWCVPTGKRPTGFGIGSFGSR